MDKQVTTIDKQVTTIDKQVTTIDKQVTTIDKQDTSIDKQVYKIVYLVDCRYWKELFSTSKLDFTMEMLFEKMSCLDNGTKLSLFCNKKIIMTLTKQNMDVEK